MDNLRLRRLPVGNSVVGLTGRRRGPLRPVLGPGLERFQRSHQRQPVIGQVVAAIGVTGNAHFEELGHEPAEPHGLTRRRR